MQKTSQKSKIIEQSLYEKKQGNQVARDPSLDGKKNENGELFWIQSSLKLH